VKQRTQVGLLVSFKQESALFFQNLLQMFLRPHEKETEIAIKFSFCYCYFHHQLYALITSMLLK